MKIVFWESERGCGLMSNMLILATYLAYDRGYRITVFELADEKQGVKDYFLNLYGTYHKAYMETLIERQVYYVSGNNWRRRQKKRKMRNGKSVKLSVLSGIRYVEKNMDMVFIDLADRKDEEARQVMREADVVIVNMKQTEKSFENFFAQYANISERIFFLIGKYIADGDDRKRSLCSKYRIPKEQMGVIPFNPEWQYVCEKKRLDSYMKRKDETKISGIKYYFIKEIEQCVEKILLIFKQK